MNPYSLYRASFTREGGGGGGRGGGGREKKNRVRLHLQFPVVDYTGQVILIFRGLLNYSLLSVGLHVYFAKKTNINAWLIKLVIS